MMQQNNIFSSNSTFINIKNFRFITNQLYLGLSCLMFQLVYVSFVFWTYFHYKASVVSVSSVTVSVNHSGFT